MNKIMFLIIVLVFSSSVFSKEKERIIYKYKKYEKFDFEE